MNLPLAVIPTNPDAFISPLRYPETTISLAFILDSTFPSFPITSTSLDIISPTIVPLILTDPEKTLCSSS